MNNLLRFLFSLTTAAVLVLFLASKNIIQYNTSNSSQNQICFALNTIIPQTSLVIRLTNNSNNQQVQYCIDQITKQKNITLLADKRTNQRILTELLKQHELPVKPDSIIPLGEMLIPDHLLTISQTRSSFSTILNFSLYEIKSATLVRQKTISLNVIMQYKKELYIALIILGLTSMFFIILTIIRSFLHRLYQMKKLQQQLAYDYEMAITLIKQDNLKSGVDLLVTIAQNRINLTLARQAQKKLKNFSYLL